MGCCVSTVQTGLDGSGRTVVVILDVRILIGRTGEYLRVRQCGTHASKDLQSELDCPQLSLETFKLSLRVRLVIGFRCVL